MQDWIKELPVAITVCDKDAIVIEMNDKAALTNAAHGGKELIGHSLYDCHQARSIEIIRQMLADGKPNTYTSTTLVQGRQDSGIGGVFHRTSRRYAALLPWLKY
jgi:DUF438 domain-containing protein